MRITSASFDLTSRHVQASQHQVRESLQTWVGARPRGDDRNAPSRDGAPAALPADPGTLGSHRRLAALALRDARQAARAAAQPDSPPPGAAPDPEASASAATAVDEAIRQAENDPALRLLRRIIEALTGKPVGEVASDPAASSDASGDSLATLEPASAPPSAPAPSAAAGFGLDYRYDESYDEAEQTQFSASGVIQTADGEQIAFSVSLEMSRAYHEETHVSIQAGDAVRKDPLVVNFDGTAAELASTRFRFDLDGDGRSEDVPLLSGGSGYLALDRNGNGRIDSGKELFGPTGGDGFAELAAFDEDRNGWIDEGDGVFSRLAVWNPSADGPGTVASLTSTGIGAISLDHADTPFELRTATNESLGAVRSTGIYVTEAGGVGTVQQLDLTV